MKSARGELGIATILRFAVSCWLLAVLASGCDGNSPPQEGPLAASGFIEGEEIKLALEVSGRIAEMQVERGDEVRAGDVLARLDDAVLQSQRLEAEAGLAAARANLARVQAGARPQAVAAAQAALAKTKAEQDGAAQAVINARDAISHPLSIDAQISAARTQVRLAEQNVELAKANLAETELKHGVYAEQGGDVKQAWDLELQAARAALTQAQAELEGSKGYLGAWQAMRSDPLTLKAQLHAAQMQYDLAEAQVAISQAALDDLEDGSTEQEIAVAAAQVQQAQAAVRLIDSQIAQLTLTAPRDGLVTTRSAHFGETATAGAPLLTLANLDEVTLVLYIPQNRVGQVRPGQEVNIQVDSFPQRTFVGRVVSIGGQAEFTPRNVQTKEERVNLVFAVKVRIANPDHALKPGMPADATISP